MPRSRSSTPNKADVIEAVCEALLNGNSAKARKVARSEYRFQFHEKEQRQITPLQALNLFWRDGFVDRYSGQRLVFPGILRLLSKRLPKEFPYHRNWKMSECHIAYYELSPTIDHVMPVARGGLDDESNWVTTSMLRNSAKANWTLEELGWKLYPAGNVKVWDGLTHLFIELIESQPNLLQDKRLSNWYRLAHHVLRT
ncbi:MAG: HNH endonuclease [Chloroflexi bacterium]|nr:HNH endonuclease [Chloroflexota bacterium]